MAWCVDDSRREEGTALKLIKRRVRTKMKIRDTDVKMGVGTARSLRCP